MPRGKVSPVWLWDTTGSGHEGTEVREPQDFKTKLNYIRLEVEDMVDVAMTKESRVTRPPIPYAFVMPQLDYNMSYAEGLKFEATSIRHAQEYRVFGWDLRRENWKLVGRFSDGELGKAEAAAREWHEKVLAKTGSHDEESPPSNETLQDIAVEDRAEDAAMEAEEA